MTFLQHTAAKYLNYFLLKKLYDARFFKEMGLKASKNGHAIDIFACSLDQAGLMELCPLVEETGGYVVMTESFKTDVFKESLKKIFTRDQSGNLQMVFNAELRALVSLITDFKTVFLL
jgi:hypothetical protein